MIGDSLNETLAKLQAERNRLDQAITALEGLVSGGGAPVGRRRGRRAAGAAPAAKPARARGKRSNAPRGMLKAKIQEILKGEKKPMAPVDLRNKLIQLGYPNQNPRTLYTAIFAAAKGGSGIKKTKEGFSLK